ncbi:uncharacterized protein [Anabrus simplex]|uniref:uncharacterized protein n=1 Tax=Anabrus simplex TaxID=316456 RepID=UPI0035A349EB
MAWITMVICIMENMESMDLNMGNMVIALSTRGSMVTTMVSMVTTMVNMVTTTMVTFHSGGSSPVDLIKAPFVVDHYHLLDPLMVLLAVDLMREDLLVALLAMDLMKEDLLVALLAVGPIKEDHMVDFSTRINTMVGHITMEKAMVGHTTAACSIMGTKVDQDAPAAQEKESVVLVSNMEGKRNLQMR